MHVKLRPSRTFLLARSMMIIIILAALFFCALLRLVCLTCFSWKLVGIMTTATAVAILEVALAVSARASAACMCPRYCSAETSTNCGTYPWGLPCQICLGTNEHALFVSLCRVPAFSKPVLDVPPTPPPPMMCYFGLCVLIFRTLAGFIDHRRNRRVENVGHQQQGSGAKRRKPRDMHGRRGVSRWVAFAYAAQAYGTTPIKQNTCSLMDAVEASACVCLAPRRRATLYRNTK